jgi:hypothetical protein
MPTGFWGKLEKVPRFEIEKSENRKSALGRVGAGRIKELNTAVALVLPGAA